MKIADKILLLLQENGELSVKELIDILEVSKQTIHKAINSLLEKKQIIRLGKAPRTIYKLKINTDSDKEASPKIDQETSKFLEEQFLIITELGEIIRGVEGFSYWCRQRKQPIEKTISEFIKTKEKYNQYFNSLGIIDGKEKFVNTKGYESIYLDEIYYLDFYAIERFGKTKLGTLLHYAKQGQNKYLMKMLLGHLNPKLTTLLNTMSFNAVGYVPPTIRREVQLMKYLETHLKINLPRLRIQKISGIIPVPQKSLNKLEERIRNADNTFAVNETIRYEHVLLIDDAVGSGATLNQLASKLKQKHIAQKITGLAIVGSFKGFDVITDV